jgi:hypothetical protein
LAPRQASENTMLQDRNDNFGVILIFFIPMAEAISRKEKKALKIPKNFALASGQSSAKPPVFCKHAARTII